MSSSDIAKELSDYIYQKKYSNSKGGLCKKRIQEFAHNLLEILFPQIGERRFTSADQLFYAVLDSKIQLATILDCFTANYPNLGERKDKIIEEFLGRLFDVEQMLQADAQYILEEDPAAESIEEVITCYPGFFAIAIYRLAHELYLMEIPVLPRVLTEYAHVQSSVDIHPGAKIASPFFIDHGTGIVIGETTIIGRKVKIFQGVTLGALSVDKGMQKTKRHPTIEDNCLIYSNATILGGNTVIGNNSIIGGNVWLTQSVEANSQLYHLAETKLSQNKN
ncbi:MAG: serine acetyltransferase [Bdellovibrionales bacterium]|jgi:serine O-acetyltransferase|nr:serine acetyltransferase [Bdellovibrionales bacterium]MBT3525895.1 serine acetyltransferase [Bdellovibrionales bacterium]MBT7670044.1 serine acetyltransferase [Bdellovibrionales bacterium]MBT7765907.1 serine acetyltransferase [Bdellovibrionales bacterium]